MTPIQKARKIKKERSERSYCIKQGVCPDCGSIMQVTPCSEAEFDILTCVECPSQTNHHKFLWWKWTTTRYKEFVR